MLKDPEGGLFVSRPGEILPAESYAFYSYDTKYIDEDGAALKKCRRSFVSAALGVRMAARTASLRRAQLLSREALTDPSRAPDQLRPAPRHARPSADISTPG